MAMQAGAYYIEYRIRKFADYTRKMIGEVGGAIKPYLKTSYNNIRDTEGMEEITKEMDSYSDVMNTNIDDILKSKDNVFDRPRSSEPDSQELTDEVQPDENTIQSQRGTSGHSGRGSTTGTGGPRGGRTGGKLGSGLFSDFSGEGSDNTSDQQDGTEVSKGNDAGDIDSRGNDVGNREGLPNNKPGTISKSQGIDRADGVRPETFEERTEKRIKEQTKAEPIPVKLMDEGNIRETLPLLLPEQQDDVLKAETRFYSPKHANATPEKANGKGFLFTNGTGTGKTFTGLGIAKRFDKQGKKLSQ